MGAQARDLLLDALAFVPSLVLRRLGPSRKLSRPADAVYPRVGFLI